MSAGRETMVDEGHGHGHSESRIRTHGGELRRVGGKGNADRELKRVDVGGLARRRRVEETTSVEVQGRASQESRRIDKAGSE